MIINDKRKETTVKFYDIKAGECFIYPEDNSICMKIFGTDKNNSVDLHNGELFFIGDNSEVIKVNSRLEIW